MERVFDWLAVFPEQVTIPSVVFDTLALAITEGVDQTEAELKAAANPRGGRAVMTGSGRLGRSHSEQGGAAGAPARSARARWAMQRVRAGLQRLTRSSLLMGSMAEGLRWHAMVLSYTAARQDPEAVRQKQEKVVAAFLAARPEEGFTEAAATGAKTAASASLGGVSVPLPARISGQQEQQRRLCCYIQQQLTFHMREALENADDVEDSWLSHPDPILVL